MAILSITLIIVMICFAYSMYKILALVAAEDRLFPIWCIWLMAIPLIGIIFQWLMMPFGLPKSLKAHLPNDQELQAKSDKLFKLGLAYAIVASAGLLISFFLVLIPMLILLVLYWLELSKIRQIIQPALPQP